MSPIRLGFHENPTDSFNQRLNSILSQVLDNRATHILLDFEVLFFPQKSSQGHLQDDWLAFLMKQDESNLSTSSL